MTNNQQYSILSDVKMGEKTTIYDQVNLYKCEIGDKTKVDAFVYIEEDVVIGKSCTIRPFTFIPTGVTIEDNVFIGPGVMFTNDNNPTVRENWALEETFVGQNASIGAGATILPDVIIGDGALVGAGAVVTSDVPSNKIVAGNPARIVGER
jgi:acetyltransferase-like isoleucine patch superfamily enzyme